jgi:hypothetical protein
MNVVWQGARRAAAPEQFSSNVGMFALSLKTGAMR